MVTWVGELGQFRSFNTLTPRWHQTCSRGLVGQVAYEGQKGGNRNRWEDLSITDTGLTLVKGNTEHEEPHTTAWD